MKYLLDTHTFLWYLLGDRNLGLKAKEIIDTKENLHFSIVSLWEIAIKINIGKLTINRPIDGLLAELQYINAQILSIGFEDIELYAKLSFPTNHRDPFDRLMVAQAMNHGLVLLSRDSAFDAYSIQRLWL
ncbi:type II toxin-antitoxin system VapC family toxin [Nostoc sp. CMAA1605]|uniref:type II toxin-antitoxin system VapC family toxin n=1 Tax=Nostoc sp. CMAA1605 TaxID=2055159 RepID=UPI001F355C74|nr:type II toxin-antitoxin system VapC family toxin [Nostoc sp. CMAA1605]MCF4966266.1 PIN domain nuclease [Nostoc sp. CMAA1605]